MSMSSLRLRPMDSPSSVSSYVFLERIKQEYRFLCYLLGSNLVSYECCECSHYLQRGEKGELVEVHDEHWWDVKFGVHCSI